MSAYSLHLINPFAIQPSLASAQFSSSHIQYAINNINPLLITNDELVSVSFSTTNPSENDWIGAYSPPGADIFTQSPVKFGMCSSSSNESSSYLSSGYGILTFNMTNLRAGIDFYYFSNGTSHPVLVANYSSSVQFKDINQPLKNRIVPTGNPNVFKLLWSSAYSTQPVLKWGIASGVYTHVVNASSETIQQSELCGGPANSSGYFDLGLIHTANITGIKEMNLNSKNIYYKFGDLATNDFSEQFIFLTPPFAGFQPPGRPTQIVLMADLGVASTKSSYDTKIWDEGCPPAINTTMSITQMVLNGEVDAVFHTGDIAYANGYLSSWDFYLDMISPIVGRTLYLTTVGNHESDWRNSASLPYGDSSGGECGVCALKLIPMPSPATVNQPWWSYDIGLIHFIGISTEHNYSVGSNQYNWLENDLANVNRFITPWVVLSGHRSMYVDSDLCCDDNVDDNCVSCYEGSDVGVMQLLQQTIEPLIHQYKVNLAFSGHFHNMQRQAAVYQNKVVQNSTIIMNSDGDLVAYHDNPNATVWMVIGSAGNGPDYSSKNYSWSEKYWNNVYGYAILTATNASYLNWQLVNSANNEVIDRMVITQLSINSDIPTHPPTSSNGNSTIHTGLPTTELGIVLGVTVFTVLMLAIVAKFFVFPRIMESCCKTKDEPLSVQSANDMI
eukprot:gene12938-17346_t